MILIYYQGQGHFEVKIIPESNCKCLDFSLKAGGGPSIRMRSCFKSVCCKINLCHFIDFRLSFEIFVFDFRKFKCDGKCNPTNKTRRYEMVRHVDNLSTKWWTFVMIGQQRNFKHYFDGM